MGLQHLQDQPDRLEYAKKFLFLSPEMRDLGCTFQVPTDRFCILREKFYSFSLANYAV